MYSKEIMRDIPVSKLNGCGLYDRGSIPGKRQELLNLPPRTHQVWDIPNLLSVQQAFFPRIKTAIELSHALQCTAKVKNMWSFTPFFTGLDLFLYPVKCKCLIPGFQGVVYKK